VKTPEEAGRAGGAAQWIERAGRAIPDPIVIFMGLWVIVFAASVLLGGTRFEVPGPGGTTTEQSIRSMATAENVRWIFDNAILANWLAFGGGVLGIIIFIIMAVGVAEHTGLLGALIKRAGAAIPERFLALAVVFLGIMSSLASDAGYLILVPLAGLLYASLGKHPLVGMAAAFAGVSAGFSANLVPGTTSDIIMGVNARAFAEASGIAFASADGRPLNPATMTYWFTAASVFLLAPVGAFVTHRFVAPRLARVPHRIPDDMDVGEFALTPAEQRGLKAAGLGLLLSLAIVAALGLGPLAPFTDPETGQAVNPFLERLVLLIALTFILTGTAYGIGAGKVRKTMDVVQGMIAQMNTMGYVVVLTFFAYNALALITFSGLGSLVTQLGASGLLALGLEDAPILLLVGFVALTATLNLVIGGLTSKWLLLGPLFIPMLYAVNPAMTPDVVAAAYRVGDSVTNIVTPMMFYAGVILAFARRYVPGFSLGELFILMFPYSIAFLLVWTSFLIAFFALGLPLGF
jgi:aminobenzoyl-glutamate transport protein